MSTSLLSSPEVLKLERITLDPLSQVSGEVYLPGSKSLSNRALLLAALAQGDTRIANLLDADDTKRMREALTTLGVNLTQAPPLAHSPKLGDTLLVQGTGGRFKLEGEFELFLGNAGTAFRPLIAALACNQGSAKFHIHGEPRMHERPVGHLVSALAELGCLVEYLQNPGYAPLNIYTGALAEDYLQRLQAQLEATGVPSLTQLAQETFAQQGKPALVQTATGTVALPQPVKRVDLSTLDPQAKQVPVCHVAGNISSQFLTALLLTAPTLEQGLLIKLTGELVSIPYIELTLGIMKQFGVRAQVLNDAGLSQLGLAESSNSSAKREWAAIYVAPQQYRGISGTAKVQSEAGLVEQECAWLCEGDASSASYPLLLGAVAGEVTVYGIDKEDSLQGDVEFIDVLKQMGALIETGNGWVRAKRNPEAGERSLRAVSIDANRIPDAAMGLAIAALFCPPGQVTTISNIYNWRLKECDRLDAMRDELRKFGVHVETTQDSISVTAPESLTTAQVATYNDHRIAMCFSIIALHHKAVAYDILDPGCVAKTFPTYWKVFGGLGKC